MNILQSRKSIENGVEFLAKRLLRVLDLTGVEGCKNSKSHRQSGLPAPG